VKNHTFVGVHMARKLTWVLVRLFACSQDGDLLLAASVRATPSGSPGKGFTRRGTSSPVIASLFFDKTAFHPVKGPSQTAVDLPCIEGASWIDWNFNSWIGMRFGHSRGYGDSVCLDSEN